MPCCSQGSRPRCRSAARVPCSSASFPACRHRPLCRRCVRRVPGSVRRRLLCRQGHLRHRCLRGRTRRPGAGLDPAQPRSVRGHLRPRRSRHRCRGRRGLPLSLRRRRHAPPPLGTRRLAIAAVDIRSRADRRHGSEARRHSGNRPLEDARQSAANAVGTGLHALLAGGMGVAVRGCGGVDRLSSC